MPSNNYKKVQKKPSIDEKNRSRLGRAKPKSMPPVYVSDEDSDDSNFDLEGDGSEYDDCSICKARLQIRDLVVTYQLGVRSVYCQVCFGGQATDTSDVHQTDPSDAQTSDVHQTGASDVHEESQAQD